MNALNQEIREFESLTEVLEDLDREGITGVQKRRIMENFLMRKSRLHGRPYCASFELTPLCNFDCKMCYLHLTKVQMQRQGRVLTTEEWLDIARQAVDSGVTSVDLTGGECLTHPGFREIYLYLVKRGVHVSVLTNGQLITEDLVRMFVEYKPSVVQISLYGSCSEAYVKVTGREAFQDVMNAIDMLKAAKVRVKLSVTPNRFMQDDAADLLDLLHEINVDYSIGSTTLPARPETGRELADYIIDNQAYVEICKLETMYRTELAKKLSLSAEKSFEFRIKGQDTFSGPPCASGSANFHINWKGEMMPCIAFHTVSKSVFDSGLEDAWVWIREKMKQYSIPSECMECDLKDACIGCPAEKTAGVLNGPVNRWVCKRLRASVIPSFSTDNVLSEPH